MADRRKKVNMSVVKEVCVWIIEIAITLLVAFTLVYFVGLRTSVVGQSMAETLNGGDEILVNRFIYKVTDPRPNDVIVFLPNGNEKSHYYIKRVIAVPGDTLQIKNGEVYVNGELFAEDGCGTDGGCRTGGRKRSRWVRTSISCSATTAITARTAVMPTSGNIKKEYIIGKVWFRVAPFKDFGFL